MKIANYLRVFILLSFIGALLCACENIDSSNTCREEAVEGSNYIEVKPLTYKGHKYLWFRSRGHKDCGGITHDPECPNCRNSK